MHLKPLRSTAVLRARLPGFILAMGFFPALGCGSPFTAGPAPKAFADGGNADAGADGEICTEEASASCTRCTSDNDCASIAGLLYPACTLNTGVCQDLLCRGDYDCPPMELCSMDGVCVDRSDPNSCAGMRCNTSAPCPCPAVCGYVDYNYDDGVCD
jgi:hypothetical protein